jgi:tRNA 2-thiouridine synthesizing protein B
MGQADGATGRDPELLRKWNPHVAHRQQIPLPDHTLDTCLRMAQPAGAAADRGRVYAATVGSAPKPGSPSLASLKVYACSPTWTPAAVTGKLIDGVTLVDYAGFVDLTLEYSTSSPGCEAIAPRYPNFFIWRKT